MGERISNYNKILQAVLLDEKLMAYGEYDASECRSLDVALGSDNHVVYTVAQIIQRHIQQRGESEIYKEITAYLKQNL